MSGPSEFPGGGPAGRESSARGGVVDGIESARTGLTVAAETVVARWNPHGLALLNAMSGQERTKSQAVALISGDDATTMLLRVELAKFVPHIPFGPGRDGFGDPAAEPGAGAVCPVALVVLDAGAVVGAEMIGVVERLRGEGARVVLALEGIHAHEDWEGVLARDVTLLGEPVVPVSGRMAAVGRGCGDAALADRAGVGLLHARLVEAMGAGAAGDQVDIVRQRVVRETRRRIEVELGKLRGGEDVAGLREERAALLAVGDGGRGVGMGMLRNRLHLARVDLVHEVGSRVRGLNAALRGEIDRLGRTEQEGFPQRLSESVEKLTREIDRASRVRLGELSRQLEESVGGAESESNTGGSRGADGWASEIVGSRSEAGGEGFSSLRMAAEPGPRSRGVEDHLMIALGASAGFGLGRLVVSPLALLQALEYAIVPVSLLLGAAVAGWVVRARGQLADRSHLQQWVADTLVNVKAQLEQRVATALVEAEERLTDRIVAATTARMIETDRRVGELEAQLRQAAQRRPALSSACERDLIALEFV